MNHPKLTDGLNDHPREAPIGQSAGGFPDDSSQPIMVEDAEAARIAAALGINDQPSESDIEESEAHPS
ncbi:hypothetical protein [Aureimonas sp. SK2]|uniref:hypothetical protein n=1 Tax=Aureimonas sp. SK2 TaxID=3015992 RepID=UPI002444C5B9|nr:hypothetical protein [Aureimonas sp. SK2]